MYFRVSVVSFALADKNLIGESCNSCGSWVGFLLTFGVKNNMFHNVNLSDWRGGRAAEGRRLLIVCGVKTLPWVRIPPSP